MDLSVDDLANWTALIGLVERFITVAVYEEDPTAQGGAGPFGKYPYLGSLKYVPPHVVKGSQLFGPGFVGKAHQYR